MKLKIELKILKNVRKVLYFALMFYWAYWFISFSFHHHIFLALFTLVLLADSIYEMNKTFFKEWFKNALKRRKK